MYKVRIDEPEYAFLSDTETQTFNRYGQAIETVGEGDVRRHQSLNINSDDSIGDNPNRYKQHGFFFTADNCIACHACEAACSEKNDVPAHLSFRSVGFVEGGTYPAYQRLNISLACNHCDDPVCLKGCPTRAYTKFAEYGAVLQDPDICFGCGYCTWVCPYNAPQLDPVKGEVSKCNMCVDRLEVGLKPACVSACLGKALDFGVIENIPEDRHQATTEIPGFPDASITRPNVRFQNTRTSHREMTRSDSMPIKYHRDDSSGKFEPVVDKKHGKKRHWNLGRLFHSHENAHALFTLSTQTVMGAFLLSLIGAWLDSGSLTSIKSSAGFIPLLVAMVSLLGFGLFKLNMHLGKPHRFYRGFNNLRHSPVSREIAAISAFFTGLAGYVFFSLFDLKFTAILASLFAFIGLLGLAAGSYYMVKLYRIPARPYWDHWQTATAFYATKLSLGSLLVALFILPGMQQPEALLRTLAIIAAMGLVIESLGLAAHCRYLQLEGGEAAAAHYEQTTTYGNTTLLRNFLLGLNLLLLGNITLGNLSTASGTVTIVLLLILMPLTAWLSRILFYALVIPTTMPGAFFWKNKGFIEHARETGLADMPQLGVAYERHHAFDIKALMQTIRDNKLRDLWSHTRRILAGG